MVAVDDIIRDRLANALGPRRLLHGRGRCYVDYEDVTVDWFPPYVVVASFGDVDRSGFAARLADLPGVEGVVLQRRRGRTTQAHCVAGSVPEAFLVEEAGLRFEVRPFENQNIGFFLDMAPIREYVRPRVDGAKVLNLFAFTCAFSVVALAGGARHVVNNDMSKNALAWGRRNHEHNDQDVRATTMLPYNVFKSWWKLKQLGPYDLIIVDPPSRQRGSFDAERDYASVLKRLPEMLAPGGRVLACLNSPFLPYRFLEEQTARRCPQLKVLERLKGAQEFEEQDEDRALKIALLGR